MNDLLQPSIKDVNERMCGNCDALVCAGCPVYEMDKLAALRARVGELEQERDELRDALKSRLQKILSDDRINYPPASVMINAPLALIQVNLDTEKEILEWAISLLDAALVKGAK